MRLPDWDARLLGWADAMVGQRFEWGRVDCAQICLEAFCVMTGRTNPHAGAYDTERAALRYQKDVASVQSALLDFGCLAVQPGFRQRGDFILIRDRAWRVGSVCLGEVCLSVHPERGVIQIDTAGLLDQSEALVLRVS